MILKDTVDKMCSVDYKERFVAEYQQLKIRYEKLKAFNNKIEAATRTKGQKNAAPMPKHDCPDKLLREQQRVMGEYLHLLEVRAVIEGIDLANQEMLQDVIRGCPVRIGETVVAWVEDENKVVDRVYWEVCGIVLLDGEWWAIDADGEKYKVGSPLCTKMEDKKCQETI